jgi:ketosteroid isomerase-like protein
MMVIIHYTPTGDPSLPSNPETEIADLFSRWVSAVQAENLAGIRANHAYDMLMYDLPLPFVSRGLDAYMETWKLFFPSQARPIEFRFEDTRITAGKDVAFLTAIGHCGHVELGEKTDLKFRLTMGLRKDGDQWFIVHEHHSVPAQD